MKSARFAALLSVLLVVGAARVAWGSAGAPLILGQDNKTGKPTTLTDGRPGLSPAFSISAPLAPGLTVTSGDSDAWAIQGLAPTGHDSFGVEGIAGGASSVGVAAGAGPDGIGLDVAGRSDFGGPVRFVTSGIAMVPAGRSHITVPIPSVGDHIPVPAGSFALATLQQHVGGLFVLAAVIDAASQTVTIYLSRHAPVPVPVGWFVANPD